jgi:hypothetical protein
MGSRLNAACYRRELPMARGQVEIVDAVDGKKVIPKSTRGFRESSETLA